VLHTAKLPEHKIPKKITVPDYAKRLPKGIRPFTTQGVYDLGKKTHLSFTQGAGHGGSHPHLAHEFVTALVEGREPYPNARQSANWTCVGLCAHDSRRSRRADVALRCPAWRRGLRTTAQTDRRSTHGTTDTDTPNEPVHSSQLIT
jgi:hypothetical protein